MDTVKRWAYKKGFMLKKGSTGETHLLFNKGRLQILRDAEAAFLETYAKWIEDGRDLFVIEQRTSPTFRMFVDLDYETKKEVSKDELKTVCQCIQRTVLEQVGEHAARCVVSCADKPKATKDGLLKTGVHLVWPDIQVDSENALRLRTWVLAGLHETFGQNDWPKMVDISVYTRAGLRLNGSIKRAECTCRGRDDACNRCQGKGEVFDRRKYAPLVCYAGPSESPELLELCMSSISARVRLTSIRVPFGEERESTHIPQCESMLELEPELQERCHQGKGSRLEADNTLMGLLTRELGEAFPSCFKDGEELSDIVQMSGDDGNPYFLVHTNSCFCHNLGRCHNSNRVYFYIDSQRLLQKCFCTCNTTEGRKMGLCSQYSSAPHPNHYLLSFILHVALVLGFLVAFRKLAPHINNSLQARTEGTSREAIKATQARPPLAQRACHPVAFDKAADAIRKFELCESSFLEDKRHRSRTYLNAVEQSSRCMKHLYRLKRAMPNDMAAENRLDYFVDYIESTMTDSLRAMARQSKRGKALHHMPPTFPLASNVRQ
ncbi:hypothetical protein KFL_007120130 [Klebsormidium nitens]|uniref:C962R-like N-terminal AEP domain-containing protein n=1 Tax=Klebsormidium nitens TaxID=105231 RepID=A0A1Y1ING6_KLENI|nr:hypothetical protein KFL_007120130 [Klebsormidium nitens]|eukprot:GAQ91009.1 hypothetical protein KFL_007120130 [Klebsormidium nitens]